MLLKAKKKNGRYLVSLRAVNCLCPVRRRPWAKLTSDASERALLAGNDITYPKDKLQARLCVPRWVHKLIDNEEFRAGLRVRPYADTERRLGVVGNGTVIAIAISNRVPYLKVKIDGQTAREAIYYHPSRFTLAAESAPLARKRLRYRITWATPKQQEQLKQAA